MNNTYVISEEIINEVKRALEDYTTAWWNGEFNLEKVKDILIKLEAHKRLAQEITEKVLYDILVDWCISNGIDTEDVCLDEFLEKLNEKKEEAVCFIL